MLDRTALALKGIEDERKKKVDPLNLQVFAINQIYHDRHNTDSKRPGRWDRPFQTLKGRISGFMAVEERKRREALEAAHAAKEEAEQIARQAEQREQQAAADAAQGICDVDIGGAMANADAAFADFQRAGRDLARAKRDTKVRIGGGFGKVSTLRNKEILTVTDWKAAISEMTDDGELPAVISDAILTAARAYRKAFDQLPAGIHIETERTL
jgi:23S rRNA pseudoU1915 N3-methylase RlmH